MVAAWVEQEFESLELGDKRLNRRGRLILDAFARIAESTPDACRDNAFLEGTYRFMSNPDARPEAILQAHNQASIARTAEHETVVLAQDTTVIDLTKPNKQVAGAGPLEHEGKRGVFLHPLYAMTESGLPLGIVDQVIWKRSKIQTNETPREKEKRRKQTVFEEKESCRWLEMQQSGEQIARANPGTRFIGASDSESDICEEFVEVPDLPPNYDLIIRGCQPRAVIPESNQGAKTVDEALEQADFRSEVEVQVSPRVAKIEADTRARRASRPARTATIKIRAARVTLRGPERPGGKLPNVTLNVVEAVETNPPANEEPIRWILYTTLPISSVVEIQRVLSTYALRWQIELYFKTLKTGLGIEKLKYETLDRYLTALSLLMIVGWRVEMLKGASRFDPESSCEKYFERVDWVPAHMVLHPEEPLPQTPPTISEFMLMVARLGGYINKKGQGPPGSMTIWRGLRRIEAYTEAYQAFVIQKKVV